MTDDQFLDLGPAAAKNHALGQSDSEGARLAGLYKERSGIDIWGASNFAGDGSSGVSPPTGTVAAGGWWLMALGALAAVGAFFYPVGVETTGLYGLPDSVANIDRIAIRHMILASGLASLVAGCVLIAAGAIQNDLRRRPPA